MKRTQWMEGLLYGEEMRKMGYDLFGAFETLGTCCMVDVLKDGQKILFNPKDFHFGIRDYYRYYEENLK